VPVQLNLANVVVTGSENKCYNATDVITVAGDGTTFTLMPGGSATLIAGQKVLFLPGTTVQSGGHLVAYITQNSTYCSPVPPASPIKTGDLAGGNPTLTGCFRIYPNPTSGSLTIELNSAIADQPTELTIYGLDGQQVLRERVGEQSYHIDTSPFPRGIYLLRITGPGQNGVAKFIKL
jgi:hypothetical protein